MSPPPHPLLRPWQPLQLVELTTVEVGGDGAARRELEDQVQVAVDTAAKEGGDIGVPHVADGAELRQEILLPLLVRGSPHQPLHGHGLPVRRHSPVHLRVPTSAHQVICSNKIQEQQAQDEILTSDSHRIP